MSAGAATGGPRALPVVDPGPLDGPITAGGAAPCRASCPVGTHAAAYVALAAEARWDEAYDVARAPNPFPSICGRICAAPCERACRRGIVDAPIAIRALKRVLSEAHGVEGTASRWRRTLPPIPEASLPSVGIIGAGPAGLSAAHDLRLAGHPVTLYEREDRPGGMLTHGVPSFRLSRPLIEAELGAILDLGMTLRTGCEIGRDVSVDELLSEHAAILVAAGCQQGRRFDLPGVGIPGVMRAIDFLRGVNAPPVGLTTGVEGPVVVIGGGSVAFDAARSAWRLLESTESLGQTMVDVARTFARAGGSDAPGVTLLAPESREALQALPDELEHAEAEGVAVRGHVGVRRILGEDRVEGVEISPVLSMFDAEGRFALELDEARSEVIPARTVVLAIGQEADTSFLQGLEAVERPSGGGVGTDRWGRTGDARVFAAGDVVTGPRDLIEAIAFGQKAASAITQHLRAAGGETTGEPPRRAIAPPEVRSSPPFEAPARYWTGYDAIPRVDLPHAPRSALGPTHEVELGLSARAAQREAERCLRCDEQLQFSPKRCVACALCEDVCPYGCLALEPADGGVALTFDEDVCIRCRLCVDRCPADALAFQVVPR